jgi:hypothetical protein
VPPAVTISSSASHALSTVSIKSDCLCIPTGEHHPTLSLHPLLFLLFYCP